MDYQVTQCKLIEIMICNNQIPYDYTMGVTNKIKGLDLIERVFQDLQTEIHNIVQKVVTKTIPKKKKCKEEKWLSGETLQITEKRSKKTKEKRKDIPI